MSNAETESLPLSALQHYAYCPRQCALIHLERAWAENTFTAEGRVMHDRAHTVGSESRRDLRITRSLALASSTLRLHGVADIVEFHRQPDRTWQPFPVEYKRGRPKFTPIDAVQLCAQALCLEEMLSVPVPAGALFYGKTHRRHDVTFDADLRAETTRISAALHALFASGLTPPALYHARKCGACSLLDLCQPRATSTTSARAHLDRLIAASD